jgi:hypothetical protein
MTEEISRDFDGNEIDFEMKDARHPHPAVEMATMRSA